MRVSILNGMTPHLADIDGNEPEREHLIRLSRVSSLAARGQLRSLAEGIMREGEDARIVWVRGTYYRQEVIRTVLAQQNGLEYTLAAEPDNEHDRNAIAVLLNGEKIGYVPRELASDFQRMVLASRCRIAAQGPILSDGDGQGYSLGLLLAWAE